MKALEHTLDTLKDDPLSKRNSDVDQIVQQFDDSVQDDLRLQPMDNPKDSKTKQRSVSSLQGRSQP